MVKEKNKFLIYKLIDNFCQILFRILPQNDMTEKIALWWGFRFRGNPKIVKLRTGQLLKVNPTDYLQCLIYYFGMFEPQSIHVFRKLIKDGDTVLDIGGNIGLYSIVASSLVGPKGNVYTFEPAPFHCESIRENIDINNLSNIKLFETALGNEAGQVELVMPENGNLGCLTIANKLAHENSSFKVNVSVFDDFCDKNKLDVNNVSVIKIDVEGAELMVLSGMTKVFKQKPTVLIEINETALARFEKHSTDICQWFHSKGYRGWTIDKNLKLLPIIDKDINCVESIWVHPSSIKHMEAIGTI
jgi:FkbM family methyltransferase